MSVLRFTLRAHPVYVSGVLALSALMIGVAAAFTLGSWFFYIITLVFLGGVIVLIIYMTTLCTNEQLSYSMRSVLGVGLGALGVWAFKPAAAVSLVGKSAAVPRSLFSSFHLRLLVFLLRFLFVLMISVVKLVGAEFGPLSSRL